MKKSTLIPIIAIPVLALFTGLLVLPEYFGEKDQEIIHPTFAQGEDGVFLNSPSDRFFNFSNREYPAFKVWWEIENWNDNTKDIVHIEKITLRLTNTDSSLVNSIQSILTIKGIEVFDNLVIDQAHAQSIQLDEATDISRTTSDTIYDWEINTDYLIEGETTFVDWDLEKVVTQPRNHPIILFKMIFSNSTDALEKLIEVETIRADLTIKVKNYDEDGVFEGWTSSQDSIMFVFFEKDKPSDYMDKFYEERY